MVKKTETIVLFSYFVWLVKNDREIFKLGRLGYSLEETIYYMQ